MFLLAEGDRPIGFEPFGRFGDLEANNLERVVEVPKWEYGSSDRSLFIRLWCVTKGITVTCKVKSCTFPKFFKLAPVK